MRLLKGDRNLHRTAAFVLGDQTRDPSEKSGREWSTGKGVPVTITIEHAKAPVSQSVIAIHHRQAAHGTFERWRDQVREPYE